MAETLALRGVLKGHENWVTSIAAPLDNSDILLSSSRDKSVILWTLTREDTGPDGNYGYPRRSLRGHSHFVQDVVISSDGQARVVIARHRSRLCQQEGQNGWRPQLVRRFSAVRESRGMAAVGALSRASGLGRRARSVNGDIALRWCQLLHRLYDGRAAVPTAARKPYAGERSSLIRGSGAVCRVSV